ncbi:pyrroline-5-carboxylate reductase [Gordonia sp. (in: high G+C Gram-positive bacteria)]|uniref:pyrroline-5-carboxylate reductase n=1 Tax=Gordonia sp. (in: high G+C Gram-positive bacteria) TaxID=84139 RepID=UPI00169AC5D1|nr:pyrroline-5-carboxylate reductase [Gordonia sp. (in: high G+C Gram-positive bacteria)]NLG45551.1 pyrroline-5-carboxylate reductase [Gordonia sp. (in: high G+C Gram-positive bacteria)]
MTERVAIIGGGKIGEALLAGLIGAGKPVRDLVVAERSPDRAAELGEDYGVRVTDDISDAAEGARVVFIAVKPDAVDGVLQTLSVTDDEGELERITVTLVAGIPTTRYEAALQAGSPVIRVMPNTPMLVNEAMSAVSPGRYAEEEQVALTVRLLESVGKVMVVPEKLMDAVTAISGSGPAYFFLMVEAMIDAGVALGLTRPQASELAVQTIKGAGMLLSESGLSPVELRAAVTSPAGTTAAALREFERAGLRHAVNEATAACAEVSAKTARRVEVEGSGQGVQLGAETASEQL